MADKKFSELETASEIKNSDFMALSQDTGNGLVSLKATILAIANKIVSNINFTSALQTNSKTITGAINEVAQGGGGGGASTEIIADDFDATSTYAVGDYVVYDGKLYKCTTAVSTAGQWDANDWTETIVMDEVGQGGGGTGGHTIIDENGNSMTARAGLQFVGANVDDDSTNNRTIVDLASAGGIDGVFIDTENVIQAPVNIPANSTASYTATEDCCVRTKLWCSGSNASEILIDNLVVGTIYNINGAVYHIHYLKKGQTISFSVSAQSEYTVYGIQTGTTHSKFQPIIYSTEERVVGVWKDGKPLYSKIVDIPSFSSSSPISIDVSSLNVDTMVDVVGEAYAISNNVISETLYFPIYKFANHYTAQIRFMNNTIQIYHENLNEYTSGILKIQYTKSTDTAGSGTWTPQGVPAHHYSTDEQIVGTYLGETLYEKVYTLSSPIAIVTGGSWQDTGINVTSLNIKEIIESSFGQGTTIWNFMSPIIDSGALKIINGGSIGNIGVDRIILAYTKSS